LKTDPGAFNYFERKQLAANVITGTTEGEFRLDISARFNIQIGRAEWYLKVIDTATGDLPADPLAGFLPPEDGTGRGQGYVTFSVKPKADTPIGMVITNTATIIFDYNEPIATNMVSNIVGEASDLVINAMPTTPITAGVAADMTFVVINDGPNTARQVTFTLPDVQGSTWYSLTMPGGERLATQCNVGDLANGSWREVHVHFLPGVDATLAMTPSVTSDGIEINPIDNQATFQATIADAPITDLHVSNQASVEVGATTIFTATAMQGTNITYLWNFGDGELATGASTFHVYNTIGTYTVIVKATNTTNSLVATTTVQVLGMPTPTATNTLSPTPTNIAPNTPVPTHTPTPITPTPPVTQTELPPTGGTAEAQVDQLRVTFALPPGAVNESIRVTIKVTDSPPATKGFQVLNQIFTINAVTGSGAPVTQFAKPFTLTIRYTDTAIQGLDESQLTLHYWDETQHLWLAIPTTVDADNNTLTALLDHLTTFAVLQESTDNLRRLFLPVVQR
jgi:PKD repeat protein